MDNYLRLSGTASSIVTGYYEWYVRLPWIVRKVLDIIYPELPWLYERSNRMFKMGDY